MGNTCLSSCGIGRAEEEGRSPPGPPPSSNAVSLLRFLFVCAAKALNTMAQRLFPVRRDSSSSRRISALWLNLRAAPYGTQLEVQFRSGISQCGTHRIATRYDAGWRWILSLQCPAPSPKRRIQHNSHFVATLRRRFQALSSVFHALYLFAPLPANSVQLMLNSFQNLARMLFRKFQMTLSISSNLSSHIPIFLVPESLAFKIPFYGSLRHQTELFDRKCAPAKQRLCLQRPEDTVCRDTLTDHMIMEWRVNAL